MDQEPSDGALLGQFLASRAPAAFEELLQRHGRLVLAACRRILGQTQDAEDAAQATFLMLVAKSKSLRGRESLAGWLYHVACNVARNARSAALARRKHEQEVAAMRAEHADPPEAWHDLQPLLDEELNALPKKYREPLILHHLAGHTAQQTAALTGCKPSALSMRLARGRELLKERLARRGVVLSLALLGDLLTTHGSATALTPTWTKSTASAATALGGCSTGTVSIAPSVTALMKGALQSMFIARIKLASLLLLVASVLGAAIGITAWQVTAADTPEATKVVENTVKKQADAELYDAARAEKAQVVVRVKLLRAGEMQAGARGGYHLFDEVQVVRVFKGADIKAGQTIRIGHHMSKKGVPAGDSTAYIDIYNGVKADPQAWQLLGDSAETGISHVAVPGKPLTILQADNGKTFELKLGQVLDVQLASTKPRAGWEETDNTEPVLKKIGVEFTPEAGGGESNGNYLFRYQAMQAGEATVEIEYLTPSGPPGKRGRRLGTGVLVTFKATFHVSAEASGEPNATAHFVGTEEQWARCSLKLGDIHGLWGGLSIEVNGSGSCTIRSIDEGRREKRFELKLTPEEVFSFRKLCVENNLVMLMKPTRSGVPDEGRPGLSLHNAEGRTFSVWKWANDKVPAFDKIEAALRALYKKTEGQKPSYEGRT